MFSKDSDCEKKKRGGPTTLALADATCLPVDGRTRAAAG
jgi:hypothetical protein